MIRISEIMVGEGYTQGPRYYLFSTKGMAKDYRPGAGEIRSRDLMTLSGFSSPFAQSLASLSPLRSHLRSPARYPRTSGHKQEPVTASQLSSAVENIAGRSLAGKERD